VEAEFDPDKVQRLWLDYEDSKGGGWEDNFVFAREYDELLDRYKKLEALTDDKIAAMIKDILPVVAENYAASIVEVEEEETNV
jgi:hypothetical protein